MPDEHARRIRYGEETREEYGDGGHVLYLPRDDEKCPDCGVGRGELHVMGCDVEQCPECQTQLISCEHAEVVLRD